MRKINFLAVLLVVAAAPLYGQRIQPRDLRYLGAFRLPDVDGDVTWEFSGTAMTYYPGGDPEGPADGFPGSLFVVGHDWYQHVAEISIPQPVISPSKNPDELNTARMLQPFGDIRDGLFGELEMPTVGLTYVPGSPGDPGQLYFCWGQHFQFHEPTHGFCGLDLSDPQSRGPLHFGTANNYTSCDYMFTFPEDWAQEHLGGRRIATGRFREGQWSGFGPALYAFAPFSKASPPAAGDTVQRIVPLLLYGRDDPALPEIVVEDSIRMRLYQPADQWSGATWLSSGDASAVIFVGTKAMGNNWYGFGNGVVWPDEPPYPPVPDPPFDDRGWWCDSIRAQIIFYDPSELAAVAEGRLHTWDPQPYAVLDINDVLFDPGFDFPRYKRWLLGAACFDAVHRHLFVVERRADEEKSLVHVWEVSSGAAAVAAQDAVMPTGFSLAQNYPNPFNPSTEIAFELPYAAKVKLEVFDLRGRRVRVLVYGRLTAGRHRTNFEAGNLPAGVYFYRLREGRFEQTRKMILVR